VSKPGIEARHARLRARQYADLDKNSSAVGRRCAPPWRTQDRCPAHAEQQRPHGRYVKYFTDVPAGNGYPMTVAFPKDDLMSVVNQGPFGLDRALPPEGDWQFRGVRRCWARRVMPALITASITIPNSPPKRSSLCRRHHRHGGAGTLPVSMLDHLRNKFPKAKFENVTDMVDQIKCVKSDEESRWPGARRPFKTRRSRRR